jgi:curved DNA-binding protein CbpA
LNLRPLPCEGKSSRKNARSSSAYEQADRPFTAIQWVRKHPRSTPVSSARRVTVVDKSEPLRHSFGKNRPKTKAGTTRAFTSYYHAQNILLVFGSRTMTDDSRSKVRRRSDKDRRSGVDNRSEDEKKLVGERRSGVDRRSGSDRRSADHSPRLNGQRDV